MVKIQADDPASTDTTPSPEDYATFVGQVELTGIWLRSLKVDNLHGAETLDRASIQVDDDASWEATDEGFRALQCYRLRFQSPDTLLAEIEAVFGLDFASSEAMSEPVFSIFRDINLPVNSWPYLRELVATTMGRMGWVATTLPTLKVGTRTPARSDAKAPAKAKSRRRPQPPEGSVQAGAPVSLPK